jgi:hypothetical protein
MMLMPGVDPDGNPHRLNIFDAFYQMTITLTTVGYTEAPHPFSYPQRMWLTMSIYLLVISWAYTIAVFFALVQGAPFQAAVAAQQFRRQVRRLVEPFVIVAGYGSAGRIVGAKLDENYRRFVVIDERADTVQSVVSEQLSFNVPAVQGDSGTPAVLGMAGLAHPDCEGVLALTDDDDTNLAVVMTASLLRPDLPVLGRCAQRRTRTRMEHFAPGSASNSVPLDGISPRADGWSAPKVNSATRSSRIWLPSASASTWSIPPAEIPTCPDRWDSSPEPPTKP